VHIVTFISANHAIKGEKVLLEAGINVAIMPLPQEIRAGCGICIRVKDGEEAHAITILVENKITEVELYIKQEFQWVKKNL